MSSKAGPVLKAQKRIQKEAERFRLENHAELQLEIISSDVWHVTIIGAKGTLYEGETFILQIRFTEDYPIDSPEVYFLQPAPIHPHIYSNGHICLNILGNDWSPALTIQNVCLSILSMLSSCDIKELPRDNARYIATASKSPKKSNFLYHDDTV